MQTFLSIKLTPQIYLALKKYSRKKKKIQLYLHTSLYVYTYLYTQIANQQRLLSASH